MNQATQHVMLVDDEPQVLEATAQLLELAGFAVSPMSNAAAALDTLDRSWPGAVVSDLRMPKMDGVELMQRIAQRDLDIPLILISGHADIADAVNAIRAGAYDFLEKPFHRGRLVESCRRAVNHRQLVLENRRLSDALVALNDSLWIGSSIASQKHKDALSEAARKTESLTLLGERGSGKSLSAEIIHRSSMRPGPLLSLDCRTDAIPSDWHKQIESASAGTCVLTHLDRASPACLAALEQFFVGEAKLPACLIATCRTLPKLGDRAHPMPSALYYLINRKVIEVPNLQQRVEDIPLLCRHFLDRKSERQGLRSPVFGGAFLAEMMTREWPGNVAQLEHVCSSWYENQAIEAPQHIANVPAAVALSLPERVAQFEKRLIEQELRRHNGDIKSTYSSLGVPRKTLYDKLAKHKIDRDTFCT